MKKNIEISNLENKYDVAIVGIGFGTNYGAILTNYAMFELLKSLGLTPLMIDKPRMLNGTVLNNSDYDNTMSRIFMNKYLDVSDIYNDNKDLIELNNKCDTFIVASDQSWRPFIHDPCHYYFFLDWVFDCKKKISFGTSFGNDKFEVDSVIESNTKYFLNKFDYVSTREDSGVKICKQQLGIDAVQVLDPVFVVDPKAYNKLLEQAEPNECLDKAYIGTYILDYFHDTENIVNYTKREMNLPIYSIEDALKAPKHEVKKNPEHFLAFIKNASFIITDSFHGVCFSIIFNKPFICIPNRFRGLTRFTSLLSLFGLEDRMVQSLDELKEKEYLLKSMDYSKVNEILKEQKEFSLNWLKNAISTPKKHIFSSFDYLNKLINDKENNFNSLLKMHTQKSDLLRYKLNILLNKNKIYRQYVFCKFMKLLSFGRLKDEFRNDEISYKQMLDDINEMRNNFI